MTIDLPVGWGWPALVSGRRTTYTHRLTVIQKTEIGRGLPARVRFRLATGPRRGRSVGLAWVIAVHEPQSIKIETLLDTEGLGWLATHPQVVHPKDLPPNEWHEEREQWVARIIKALHEDVGAQMLVLDAVRPMPWAVREVCRRAGLPVPAARPNMERSLERLAAL